MMNHMKKVLAIALAALTVTGLLSSCSKKGDQFGTDEQGRTMNEKTGIVYLIAPDCYAPISVEDTVYGSSSSNVYHPITGADPTSWLYGEMGMLLYAEGVTLPALDKMNVSRLVVLDSAGGGLGEITDGAKIGEAITCYTQGENEPYSGLLPPKALYTLRFEDPSLGICYVVNYLEYEGRAEGEKVPYLYCRSEKRFVAVSDGLRAVVESVIGAES